MNQTNYSNNDILYIIRNNFESYIQLYLRNSINQSNSLNSKVFMYIDKVYLDKVTYNNVTFIGNNKEFRGSVDVDVFIEVVDGSNGNYNKYKLISKISLEFVFYSTLRNTTNLSYMNYINSEIYSNFSILSSYIINTTRF